MQITIQIIEIDSKMSNIRKITDIRKICVLEMIYGDRTTFAYNFNFGVEKLKAEISRRFPPISSYSKTAKFYYKGN